ncbi:MAG TPA: hypothetical protein VFB66_06765 [Tepidisphaeraceae bacterium]|nr:hypothetical protein [Tepidisphaeraceae bacterium]
MDTRRIFSAVPRLVATGALLALSASANAGILEPGEGGSGDEFVLRLDDPQFTGETLASRSLPFEIIETDQLTGEEIGVRGTLTHSVVRESATGRLAFHYGVTGTEVVVQIDFEDLFVRGFQSFVTDVYSDQTSLVDASSNRSADGNQVNFVAAENFQGNFVVRTDATEFEEGGEAEILAFYQTGDPPGGNERRVTFDTFRPAADDGGEPNPIPLPPAAWAALATMGGFGAVKALRQFARSAR